MLYRSKRIPVKQNCITRWIHDCLEQLVLEKFGVDVWDKIKQAAGCTIPIGGFDVVANYPDSLLLAMVGAASSLLAVPGDDVLELFGSYFMGYVRRKGFGDLVCCLGDSLRTFVNNLKELHETIQRIASKAAFRFPEIFAIDDPEGPRGSDDTFLIQYKSPRGGIPVPLLIGVLDDIASSHFKIKLSWEILEDQRKGAIHTLWRVRNVGPAQDGANVPVQLKTLRCPFSGVALGSANTAPVCPVSGESSKPHRGDMKDTSTSNETSKTLSTAMASLSLQSEADFEHRRTGTEEGRAPPTEVSVAREAEVGMSVTMMGDVFPYYFKVNDALKVTQVGNELKRRLPGFQLGQPAEALFRFSAPSPPECSWDWLAINKYKGTPTGFEVLGTSMMLTGAIYLQAASEGGGAAFLMQPAVSTLSEMADQHMFFSTDIPIHSPQRALIMTNEHLKTEHYVNKLSKIEMAAKQASLEMKRTFVRYVSHEIRTPLNIVSIGLSLMQSLRDSGIERAFVNPSSTELPGAAPTPEEIALAKESLESIFDM